MRRFLVSLAAFGVVAALGTSAPAAELKASGQFKVKHIIMNETAGNQLYPRKDLPLARVDYARANMNLQFLANQHMGFVWATELDFHFGDGAYTTNRSMGGGLAADSTNLENKNVYMHFDIPNTPISFRAGITTNTDSYGGTFFNTDAAGLRLLADMGDTRINLDWLRWWNLNNNSLIDDVDVYMLTASQKLAAVKGLIGGSFYYLKDGSGDPKGTAANIGGGRGILNRGGVLANANTVVNSTTTGALPASTPVPVGAAGTYLAPPAGGITATTTVQNLTQTNAGLGLDAPSNGRSLGYLLANTATGNAAIIPNGQGYHLDSFYLGLFGNAMAGPVKLEGWGLYNFGTVDYLDRNGVKTTDAKIGAFMLDLMGSAKVQNVSLSLEGMYVSGKKDQTDKKFGFVTGNQYQLAGAFYWRHSMMILLPDGDDIDNSNALVYDVANIYENQYLGMFGMFLNASMPLPANFSVKAGVGNVMSAEKRKVNGNSQMGTEINGSLTYTITQATTVQLNAAYAWVGNFYDVAAADIAAFTPTVGGKPGVNADKDNVYYTALRFLVVF